MLAGQRMLIEATPTVITDMQSALSDAKRHREALQALRDLFANPYVDGAKVKAIVTEALA